LLLCVRRSRWLVDIHGRWGVGGSWLCCGRGRLALLPASRLAACSVRRRAALLLLLLEAQQRFLRLLRRRLRLGGRLDLAPPLLCLRQTGR
jgi:hypothetical protein